MASLDRRSVRLITLLPVHHPQQGFAREITS
jgi:hypothetical protein